MRSSTKNIIFARMAMCLIATAIGIFCLGPFTQLEAATILSDKEWHALTFFALTTASLAALPRTRGWKIACLCGLFGAAIEGIQLLVGRDGNILDWAADLIGILASVVPSTIASLRRHIQQNISRRSRPPSPSQDDDEYRLVRRPLPDGTSKIIAYKVKKQSYARADASFAYPKR